MATHFTRAIVRPPARSFAAGLTSAGAGPPDVGRALEQHAAYVRALRDCGLKITQLEPDEAYPDGTFVEDTAIVTARGAVLTRPGAPSRAGEVHGIAPSVRKYFADVHVIEPPGTVDGGDICQAGGHFLIGVSARTNPPGAQQLAEFLARMGYTSSVMDIRGNPALLHLKSGIAFLGDGAWVADGAVESELRAQRGIEIRDLIAVPAPEAYAANCVRVNDVVLTPAGYPQMLAALEARGYLAVILDMSEFRKMDGGLSCLSLRF